MEEIKSERKLAWRIALNQICSSLLEIETMGKRQASSSENIWTIFSLTLLLVITMWVNTLSLIAFKAFS
jgi:hypothetical protein